MTKGPSFQIAQGMLTCLLILRILMKHISGFIECFISNFFPFGIAFGTSD